MNPTMQTSDFTPAQRLAGGAADASEPVHETLDALCAQLWGVDAAGLRAIQSAYRELYVAEPKNKEVVEKSNLDEDNAGA